MSITKSQAFVSSDFSSTEKGVGAARSSSGATASSLHVYNQSTR